MIIMINVLKEKKKLWKGQKLGFKMIDKIYRIIGGEEEGRKKKI